MENRSNEPAPIDRVKNEHRSLALLRFLANQPCVTSNDQIVSALFDSIGLPCAQEEVRECLSKLEAEGALRQDSHEGLIVIKLTAKGKEAAQGRIVIDGILAPMPDCPY